LRKYELFLTLKNLFYGLEVKIQVKQVNCRSKKNKYEFMEWWKKVQNLTLDTVHGG